MTPGEASGRQTISVCMIAHNEENKISASLESVRFADEVIVIDCESSDRTAEIARQAGASVFSQSNEVNLNVNKNYSFDQAHGDCILCLDADEIIPEETRDEILGILASEASEAAFFLPRRNYWMGCWLKHGGNYPDRQLRLFKRGQGRFPERHLHERLAVSGKVGMLNSPLYHFPYETHQECQRKLDFYTTYEANHLYNQGVRPSWRNALIYLYWMPLQRYIRRYILKMGFLDGKAGRQTIAMDMHNFRLRYFKLRRMVKEDSIR
jgi:glycosyltransferase involved in cell wall biosynthesis